MRRSRFYLSVVGEPGSGRTSLCRQLLGGSHGEMMVDMTHSVPNNPRDIVAVEVIDGHMSRADVYIHMLSSAASPIVPGPHVVNCLSRSDLDRSEIQVASDDRFLKVSGKTGAGIDKLLWVVIAIMNHKQNAEELVSFVNGHIRDLSLVRLSMNDVILPSDDTTISSDSIRCNYPLRPVD